MYFYDTYVFLETTCNFNFYLYIFRDNLLFYFTYTFLETYFN